MKKFKKVIPIIIAFIIGISTTVGAATVFNSKDIRYSSSATTKTNVKDSLDELYTKANTPWTCASGWYCYTSPKSVSVVELGDWIRMTPTSTSYTISKELTGYKSNQTINPSELSLWRVIRKNSDGTIDMVSHFSSSTFFFYGKKGYMNFIKALNTVSAQYTDGKHILKTRTIGYTNQRETCTSMSDEDCPISDSTTFGDDLDLLTAIIGTPQTNKVNSEDVGPYFLPGRKKYDDNNFLIYVLKAENGGWINEGYVVGNGQDCGGEYSLRPVVTLKKDTTLSGGDGKDWKTAWTLN